jgi:hypothetical protein
VCLVFLQENLLEYMVSTRGIDANPKMVEAIECGKKSRSKKA